MANFRRRKPRDRTRSKSFTTHSFRKKYGLEPVVLPKHPGYRAPIEERQRWRKLWDHPWASGMMSYPAWHDRVFHNKPRRCGEHRIVYAIKAGRIDADEAIWPLSKRPHKYYW